MDYSRESQTSIEDKSREDLDTKRLLMLDLTRVDEIIGEAASRVTEAGHAKHPSIPWNEIVRQTLSFETKS